MFLVTSAGLGGMFAPLVLKSVLSAPFFRWLTEPLLMQGSYTNNTVQHYDDRHVEAIACQCQPSSKKAYHRWCRSPSISITCSRNRCLHTVSTGTQDLPITCIFRHFYAVGHKRGAHSESIHANTLRHNPRRRSSLDEPSTSAIRTSRGGEWLVGEGDCTNARSGSIRSICHYPHRIG
jgi:hypothetical protein